MCGRKVAKQTKRPAQWSEERPNDIIQTIVIHIAFDCIMYQIRITGIQLHNLQKYICLYVSVLNLLQLIPRIILSLNVVMEPVRQTGVK